MKDVLCGTFRADELHVVIIVTTGSDASQCGVVHLSTSPHIGWYSIHGGMARLS